MTAVPPRAAETAASFDALRADIAGLLETAAETAAALAAGQPVAGTPQAAGAPPLPTDRFVQQLESIQQRIEGHICRLEDEMTTAPHAGSLYGEEKDLELALAAAQLRANNSAGSS